MKPRLGWGTSFFSFFSAAFTSDAKNERRGKKPMAESFQV
jgi:hypothetical protein